VEYTSIKSNKKVVNYIQKNCTCPQVYSTVDTKEQRHWLQFRPDGTVEKTNQVLSTNWFNRWRHIIWIEL